MRNNYSKFNRYFFYYAVSFLVLVGFNANAEKVTYQDSWGQQGVTLKAQNALGVTVNFSIREFSLDTRAINGESMQEISLDGIFLPNGEGAPNLPTLSKYVAIPQGATASVEIVKKRVEIFQNIEMAPAPRIPLESERGPLQYNRDLSIYGKNAFYPAQPAVISSNMKIRGLDVVMLSVSPYQYNPVTKELVVYRDMEVRVNFTGGNGQFGESRLRSRYWDPIIMDHSLNYESIPVIDYSARTAQNVNTDATGCEYLIIIPNDPNFKKWADTINAYRTEQGILTKIVSLQEIGGSTTGAIETYINNAYNTWDIPPSAILIMADFGSNAANSITSPIWDNYCVSDNIYGDVDGDDLPDIAMARMTASNATQLETYMRKFLDYERTPPTDPYFYAHPITALGWQTERWFQICSEVVGGFFKNSLGKQPIRINAVYEGNPDVDPWSTATNTNTVINYFGPNGLGYIPSTPQVLGGWTGGTAAVVNTNLNLGAFILQHRDHGMETGWGEPSYVNSSIDGLTNVGKLSYIMSVNCLTGKYNYTSECFAEKFHRYKYNGQNAGCVGILAASETSYSFVNDTYVWGMYDNMWPEFMPAYGAMFQQRGIIPSFGNAAGKYFLQQSSWPYNTTNKVVTYHLFHHHSDAFLTIFSEVPQVLTVSHPEVMISTASTFNVTADAGSFIALTANGVIIGTGAGTGSPVAVSVVPPAIGTTVKVVVTKQNFYRHYSSTVVISAENPYVITDSYTINDLAGNSNQSLDFGEDAFLSLSEKNVGNNPAENVVVNLTATDPYITITDNTEQYPSIPSQQTVTVENGFKVQIANNVPDGYQKLVTATATNGIDSWVSYFNLQCHAPRLVAGVLSIDDSQGGNGNNRLDAGETAKVRIVTSNSGTSVAPGVNAGLSVSSGLITLNSSTYSVGTINPLGLSFAEFNITVSPDAPEGLSINFDFSAVSGEYSVQRTYVVQSGIKVEDWETGDFTKFSWTSSGNLPWTITNEGPYEGVYSAKSGAVNNSQNSQLVLSYNVPNNDSIKFFYKTSCEQTTDGLKFYIDNSLKASYSGTTPWTLVAFPVAAGNHTFKFVYSKNGSGSAGSDCAWLDFIVLPLPLYTTSSAGNDGMTCQSSPYPCNGNAANYSTIAWTSSGTGMFSNPTILDPIYTPSLADVAAGQVTLTIKAVGATDTITDNMVLSIQNPATAYAGANATICSGPAFNNEGATATNYTNLHWISSGSGYFTDPALLLTEYTPSSEDIISGSVTLTLTAANQSCEAATSTKTLTLHSKPAPVVVGENKVCALTSGTIYSTPSNSSNTYEWTVSGGVIQSGAGTSQIIVNWGTNTEGSVMVTEQTNHNCLATANKSVLVNPLPATVITGDATGCKGDNTSYSTPAVSGNSYVWNITGGTITSGAGTNQVQVSWNDAGANNISVTEIIDATLCSASKTTAVTINNLVSVPVKPQGLVEVDLYSLGTSDYTVTNATYAESYVWQILPADAGIISGNTTNANVIWNSTFRGTASINVKAVNNCGESTWSETFEVRVYSSLGIDDNNSTFGVSLSPNPNNGNFTLSVTTPGKDVLAIRIMAANGSVVYEKSGIEIIGNYSEAMKLSVAPGSYNITVSKSDGYVVKKFVVNK
ncbi:MAG: C25 family cysteine peptidase [Bacteroidales bacterium]